MIDLQNIQSLTSFQRDAAGHIERLRESGLPEVLTVNGRAEIVVQTAEAYQALLSKLELYESAAAVNRGLADYREGRSRAVSAFDAMMKRNILTWVKARDPKAPPGSGDSRGGKGH